MVVSRAMRWIILGVTGAFVCAVLVALIVMFGSLHNVPVSLLAKWPYPLKERTNVLIMGLDRTVSERDRNVVYPVIRTTVLIGASFDPASRHVYLLSIPRDTRTTVPGHGTMKINAAYARGVAPLAIRTTENLLGVSFPYYIAIPERGFVHLIDAVGGINIHIDKDLNYDDNWDGLHIHLRKGYRRLGGKAAMEFTRFRHDAMGDIGRIEREQQVMSALIDELRRPQVAAHMDRILGVFRDDITTNLSQDQLITLALFGVRLPKGAMIRETLPGRFAVDGTSDWLADPRDDRDVVARLFFDVDAAALASTKVEIINASPDRGALVDPLARLDALGVQVVRVMTTSDATSAAVILRHGDPRVAKVIAAALGGIPIIAGVPTTNGVDLTVLLGSPPARPAP